MSNEVLDSVEVNMADSVAQGSAELVLDSIYVMPERIYGGAPFTLGAVVRNEGTMESGEFTSRFALDGQAVMDLVFLSLAPGQSQSRDFEQEPIPVGRHTVSVVVDSQNVVGEHNKQDNSDSRTFQVEDGAQGSAELVLSVISLSPSRIRTSDAFYVEALIRNNGPVESGEFKVRLWLDEQDKIDVLWESLGPAQRKSHSFFHEPIRAGQHSVRIEIDPENEVQARKSQDNTEALKFQVILEVSPKEEDDIQVPVTDVGANADAIAAIDDIVQKYHAAVVELWTRYETGLSDFERDMVFPSLGEVRFNADAVLKGAVKGAIDGALELITEHAPVLGVALHMIKGEVEGYLEEKERSEKAWSKHELKEYIKEVEKAIEKARTRMGNEVLEQKKALRDEFARVSANDPQHGKFTDGHYVGGQGGQFFHELKQSLADFQAKMPSGPDIERLIATAFAQDVRWTSLEDSRLIFHVELFRLPGGWNARQTDSAWKLETHAPGDHRNLVEALQESLNGKKAWELNIPKTVYLSLSSDRDDDPWAKAEIHFTKDPGQYELAAIETNNFVDHATSQLKDAWDRPSVKDFALRWGDITD